MAGVLHQQVTNRPGNEVSRDGETSLGPCDRLKEFETIFPFTHHPSPHQLSVEVSSSEAGYFRSSTEVGNRAELVRG